MAPSRQFSQPASRFTCVALPVVVVLLLLLPGTRVGSQVIHDDLGWHSETLLGSTGDFSRRRSSCTNASEEVLAIESAIEEDNMMDGSVWLAFAIALVDQGCKTDALVSAEVAQRLFGCIVCESSSNPYYRDLLLSGQDSAALVSQLLSALHSPEAQTDLNSPHDCCGGRADVVDGTFLGGYFRDGSGIEAFRAVVDRKCARYFGQCQRGKIMSRQQDFILHQLFGNKINGTFVDVGSVDGYSFSNTLFFERVLGWRGFCLEPNPDTFPTLQKVRERSISVNACAGNETAVRSFLHCRGYTRMLSGMLHLMSSLHRERIDAEMREKGGSCSVIDSKVVTLTNVLNGAGVTHVDLLSIDTEGSELQVLMGLDFERISVSVVICEMSPRPMGEPRPGSVDAFMLSRGFERFGYVCQDMVYVHSSFDKTLKPVRHVKMCYGDDEQEGGLL